MIKDTVEVGRKRRGGGAAYYTDKKHHTHTHIVGQRCWGGGTITPAMKIIRDNVC